MRKPMNLHLKHGALHSQLGIAQGKKIPHSTLEKAAHSGSPLERKRAQFALNASKWHHGGHKIDRNASAHDVGHPDHDALHEEKMKMAMKGSSRDRVGEHFNDGLPRMGMKGVNMPVSPNSDETGGRY